MTYDFSSFYLSSTSSNQRLPLDNDQNTQMLTSCLQKAGALRSYLRRTLHDPRYSLSSQLIMKTQSKREERGIIKIESEMKDYMFYEADDLVIGKCQNNIPWPGIITNFKGYDEDQVQVFTVDFIGNSSYAHLETYLMMPLSFKNIKKMKTKYRNNQILIKALGQAQSKLYQIEKSIDGSYDKQLRFKRMYKNQSESTHFFDVDSLEGSKNSRRMTRFTGQLQPNLQKYYYDLGGNRHKSKEYIKRQLRFCPNTMGLKIEVSPLEIHSQVSSREARLEDFKQGKPEKIKREKIKTTIHEGKTAILSITNRYMEKHLIISDFNQITIHFHPFSMQIR